MSKEKPTLQKLKDVQEKSTSKLRRYLVAFAGLTFAGKVFAFFGCSVLVMVIVAVGATAMVGGFVAGCAVPAAKYGDASGCDRTTPSVQSFSNSRSRKASMEFDLCKKGYEQRAQFCYKSCLEGSLDNGDSCVTLNSKPILKEYYHIDPEKRYGYKPLIKNLKQGGLYSSNGNSYFKKLKATVSKGLKNWKVFKYVANKGQGYNDIAGVMGEKSAGEIGDAHSSGGMAVYSNAASAALASGNFSHGGLCGALNQPACSGDYGLRQSAGDYCGPGLSRKLTSDLKMVCRAGGSSKKVDVNYGGNIKGLNYWHLDDFDGASMTNVLNSGSRVISIPVYRHPIKGQFIVSNGSDTLSNENKLRFFLTEIQTFLKANPDERVIFDIQVDSNDAGLYADLDALIADYLGDMIFKGGSNVNASNIFDSMASAGKQAAFF